MPQRAGPQQRRRQAAAAAPPLFSATQSLRGRERPDKLTLIWAVNIPTLLDFTEVPSKLLLFFKQFSEVLRQGPGSLEMSLWVLSICRSEARWPQLPLHLCHRLHHPVSCVVRGEREPCGARALAKTASHWVSAASPAHGFAAFWLRSSIAHPSDVLLHWGSPLLRDP